MSQVSLRDSGGIRDDRRWIESVYREYLTDLSPSSTGVFPALPEMGHREPDQTLSGFTSANSHYVTILYGAERVGFALVTARARAAPAGAPARTPEFSMAEFFVVLSWRRRGIGAQAVRLILDRFTGQWVITEHLRNAVAVTFWRRVVAAYTGGAYQERIINGEVHQRFESASRRGR